MVLKLTLKSTVVYYCHWVSVKMLRVRAIDFDIIIGMRTIILAL